MCGYFPVRCALRTPTHLVGESGIYITNLLRFNWKRTWLSTQPHGSCLKERESCDPSLLSCFHKTSPSAVIWSVCVFIYASFHILVWIHHINTKKTVQATKSLFLSATNSLWPVDTVFFCRRARTLLSVLPLFSPWLQSWSADFHFN